MSPPNPTREAVEEATDLVIAWEVLAREGWQAEHAMASDKIIGPDNVDLDELANRVALALDAALARAGEREMGLSMIGRDGARALERIEQERDALRTQVEQYQVQMAGVSTAVQGHTSDPAKQGDFGWSVPYQDVLELRCKYDALAAQVERLLDALKVYGAHRDTCSYWASMMDTDCTCGYALAADAGKETR